MRTLIRYALLSCGWIALGFGAAGVFIPILPTAPFVLLAAACFMRSSDRIHGRLVEHPILGAHVRDYLAGKGLQRRSKVLALTTLWASVLASAVFLVQSVVGDIVIVGSAAAVTIYILRLPTCEEHRDVSGPR